MEFILFQTEEHRSSQLGRSNLERKTTQTQTQTHIRRWASHSPPLCSCLLHSKIHLFCILWLNNQQSCPMLDGGERVKYVCFKTKITINRMKKIPRQSWAGSFFEFYTAEAWQGRHCQRELVYIWFDLVKYELNEWSCGEFKGQNKSWN